MGASKGPKVEIRSRTGGPFNRAGQRWSSAWTEASAELLKDDAKMELLAKDPHIEIRVDGEFVSGPRKGQRARGEGEQPAQAPVADATSPTDAERFAELEQRLEELQTEHERLLKALEEHAGSFEKVKEAHRAELADRDGTIAKLRADLVALTAASQSTPPPAATKLDVGDAAKTAKK